MHYGDSDCLRPEASAKRLGMSPELLRLLCLLRVLETPEPIIAQLRELYSSRQQDIDSHNTGPNDATALAQLLAGERLVAFVLSTALRGPKRGLSRIVCDNPKTGLWYVCRPEHEDLARLLVRCGPRARTMQGDALAGMAFGYPPRDILEFVYNNHVAYRQLRPGDQAVSLVAGARVNRPAGRATAGGRNPR